MFARGGGAGTVLAFRPSAEAQARVWDLLARSKASMLTDDEQAELDRSGELEHLMQLVKALKRGFQIVGRVPWVSLAVPAESLAVPVCSLLAPVVSLRVP